MARLLAAVVAAVTEREGGPPDVVAVTFPANWGPFKRELLTQTVQLAGLDPERTLTLTEPEAAAISYAYTTKVQSGEVIAIFDLGGGTFDAAVLRKTDDGFEILGTPEGIEHLGGIDFDEAVFGYVLDALREPLAGLDRSDPAVLEGVARLRRDCVDAKEALSLDTEIAIPVAIGDIHTQIRHPRRVRRTHPPALTDTTAALSALRSAEMEQTDVKTVVLVGGSVASRSSRNSCADLDLPVPRYQPEVRRSPGAAVRGAGARAGGGRGAAAGISYVASGRPPSTPSSHRRPRPIATPLFVGAGIARRLCSWCSSRLKGGGGIVCCYHDRPVTTTAGDDDDPAPWNPTSGAPIPDNVIAFSSVVSDNWDIYTIGSDGSGLKRITSNAALEELPVWSPDRRTLAYSRSSAGWQLRAVSADGGEDLLITDHLAPNARATWSPDGTKLAFVTESLVSGQTDLEMFDLVNVKDTALTRHSRRRQPVEPGRDPHCVLAPARDEPGSVGCECPGGCRRGGGRTGSEAFGHANHERPGERRRSGLESRRDPYRLLFAANRQLGHLRRECAGWRGPAAHDRPGR
jgi:hypothetical protein